MATRQLEEVVRLEQHIAEFGIGDAGTLALKPGPHEVPLDHGVDREVLADVAEKRDGTEVSGPIHVVDDQAALVAFRIHETRYLPTDALDVALDRRGIVQQSFLGAPRRIPDGAGRAAQDGDGPMPGQLESTQHQ